ncbi:hypothetical protein, partial [Serratia proteamaculans]|uniref:hypothetical protein n=1 Tax=Serratia proteamaculans TaxID=28151 RepID=UPI001A936B15
GPGLVKPENALSFRLLQDYSTCCFLWLLLLHCCAVVQHLPLGRVSMPYAGASFGYSRRLWSEPLNRPLSFFLIFPSISPGFLLFRRSGPDLAVV